ncbi:MAG: hypothetical protein EZS28_055955, partial [Streblomastix strix]
MRFGKAWWHKQSGFIPDINCDAGRRLIRLNMESHIRRVTHAKSEVDCYLIPGTRVGPRRQKIRAQELDALYQQVANETRSSQRPNTY